MTPTTNASPLTALIANATQPTPAGDSSQPHAGASLSATPNTPAEKREFSSILQSYKVPFANAPEAIPVVEPRLPTAPFAVLESVPGLQGHAQPLPGMTTSAQAVSLLSSKKQLLIEGGVESHGDPMAVPVHAMPEVMNMTAPETLLSAQQPIAALPEARGGGGLPLAGNSLPFEPQNRPPVPTPLPDAVATEPGRQAAVPKAALPVMAAAQESPTLAHGTPAALTPSPEFAEPLSRLLRPGVTAANLTPTVQVQGSSDALSTVSEVDSALGEMIRSAAPVTTDRPATVQAAAPPIPLARPAGAPGWDQGLGQRILWMVDNGLNQAELRLDPPHLGSVHVRIAVQDDQAQLLFQAAHPAAREALESALPRLREMFAQQGLELADADISDQNDRAGADDQTGQGPSSEEHGGGRTERAMTTSGQQASTGSSETAHGGVPATGASLIDEFV